MNLEKTVNICAIVLLLGLALCAMMVMQHTTESNAVTTEAALHLSKKESKVVKEVRLLTLELRNLQKDVENLRDEVKRKKRKQRRKQRSIKWSRRWLQSR